MEKLNKEKFGAKKLVKENLDAEKMNVKRPNREKFGNEKSNAEKYGVEKRSAEKLNSKHDIEKLKESNNKDAKKENQPLQVLYEDNQIVVVIKPHNVPSAPDESGDEDMLSRVKRYIKEKYNKPGEAFVGLVHRLDRPTGGIMVFARNSKSAKRLSELFATHDAEKIEKVYYAVTSTPVKIKKQNLVNFLKKDEKENIVKIVPMGESGAKRAELCYTVLQENGGKSLLEVKILTGRSHQIRVQLANIGCPLVGDVKYGTKTKLGVKTTSLGLWAGKLSFVHPTTKQKLTFLAMPDCTKQPWKDFQMEKFINTNF